MTSKQLLHLENHLKTWRELHPDLASLQAAYRQRVVDFTLNGVGTRTDSSGTPIVLTQSVAESTRPLGACTT